MHQMLVFTSSFMLLFVRAGALNSSHSNHAKQCVDGLIIPLWKPIENLSLGDRLARAIVYIVSMIYLFVGVSIIADRFMAAIEVITSKEKEVKIKKPSGETQIIVVRVWNETVANLTLMALGSSAPEILLSIIEIYAKNFEAGDLGPSTIVGSAAFNLFVIIGYCCYVIPNGEVRYIKHLRVYFVTATWSVFAYIWLYFILAVTSYGIVEVWEALLTFAFFPITVITSYIADRRILYYKYLTKTYRISRKGIIIEHESKVATDIEGEKRPSIDELREDEVDEMTAQFERQRNLYIQILKDLRKKFPEKDIDTLEAMAREEILKKGHKSRAFYRIQATRKLTGGVDLYKKARDVSFQDLLEIKQEESKLSEDEIQKVFFDPGHYTVMENVGSFEVTVKRDGGDMNTIVTVDYMTKDGTANAGSDYIAVSGTLKFMPHETSKSFFIQVVDDDVYEEDEHFSIHLTNLHVFDSEERPFENINGDVKRGGKKFPLFKIDFPSVATVMILDDDHHGVFSVVETDIEVAETVGTYNFKVERLCGARGKVRVPFRTIDGTAKAGKDYFEAVGEVVFENNQAEASFPIYIIQDDSYEKDVLFYVELGEPHSEGDEDQETIEELGTIHEESSSPADMKPEEIALLGKPRLGEHQKSQIRIKESKEFKNTVDKLIKKANASILVGTFSWKEQFAEAVTITPDEQHQEDSKEIKMPSCSDYAIHFMTVFWKVLFAFVPPTDLLGGWLAFFATLLMIGLLTAILGDIAIHLGCTIGLKDTVNAIAFVALGTSIPDTFASKVAAIQDEYADASVGNVTGSNAVNVFLGIGIAWSMAAIYHVIHGTKFLVKPGTLGFSVTLYCALAAVAIAVIGMRRHKSIGGELGGPKVIKILTSLFLILLWFIYVLVSSLEAYGHIKGF